MKTLPRQKKLRADSKLAALTEEQRYELDELLINGGKLDEGLAWLRERGVIMSAQSLSEYNRNHVLPLRYRRRELSAATLNAVASSAEVTKAAHVAVAQSVFELATSVDPDPEILASMYSLLIKGQTAEQAERKLSMLEAREAEARRALNAKDTTTTPEEKLAIVKQIFGLA